jgi:chorismate lyase/3-hydroxybenzoate synthase
MIVADGSLLISGTASIVGHRSQHHGDPLAQLDETIRNLQALATQTLHQSAAAMQQRALLKVYVREPAQRPAIEARLRRAWPQVKLLFLAADICRRELLLEIEGIITP